MTRRYAEDTKVPVAKTRQDIEAALRRAGASRIVSMDEVESALIVFMLSDRLMRIVVPIAAETSRQERAAIWRGLFMVMKAKLVAIDRGISSVDQEFLADIVLPDGQTVGRWFEPGLRLAFQRGIMPTHPLMIEGPKP